MAEDIYSQAQIDKYNRYLGRYATMQNPSAADQATYKQIADKYGTAIQNGKIDTNAFSGQAYNSYMTSNPQMAQQKLQQQAFDGSRGYVDSMYDAQKQSQLAALQASRNKALGQLNQQKEQLAPQYQGIRNQADVVNMQNVNKLRELMAANGLNASGENVTAQTSLNNQRQSSLNSLNLQEQQAVNDINRQMNDVNDPYQEQAIMSALDAQRNQALMDAYNNSVTQGYQQYRDMVGDQRYQNQWDYQVGRDKVADGRYNQEWQNTLDQQKLADAWRQKEWQNTIDQQNLADAWKNKEWNQISPAQQQQMALADSYKSTGGGSGGSSGGSGKTSGSGTALNGQPTVKLKSPAQSYQDGMLYWNGQIDQVREHGAYRVEQELRNNPQALQELANQGYNIESVIDALYSAASNGRFKSKADYNKYVQSLQGGL